MENIGFHLMALFTPIMTLAFTLAHVETTERGLLVNGRPFFPFGIFCVGWTAEDSPAALADAARLGSNTVHSYWAADPARSIETVEQYLDEAARLGLKVIVTVGDYSAPRKAVKDGANEELRRVVRRMIAPLKNHPALLCWYVWDEPNAEGFAAAPRVVRVASDAIKREDPSHPTSFSFTPWHNLETIDLYGKCCDVMIVDPYVRAKYMDLVPRAVEAARRAAGPMRPVWSIIWAAQNAGAPRPQTSDVRCATYLSLIHGATGIFYYGHKGEPGRQRPTPGKENQGWQLGVGEPELADVAETIAQLGAEIRVLTPALLAQSPPQSVTVSPSDGPLHLRELRMGDRTIILAANASQRPVQAKFALPSRLHRSAVRVMFERRRIEGVGASFGDEFAPMGAHVYELAK